MIDYAENLCEAMKIILEKQIRQLSFDITIDATVVDTTNAKNGMYVVSYDGATFTAYSTDTSFKEKDVVMVTIPQGNYDNQKMIIGKQVDKNKEEKPITYQSPFSQIVNLSGNLVYGNIGEEGLLANEGNQYQEEYQTLLEQENLEPIQEVRKSELKSLIENAQKKVIYSLGESEQIPLSEEYQSNGYTRIGLRADFSTWLNEFNVVSGNYGLILTLKFKNPDVTDLEENSIITAIYTFDSSEFFGDIYNFETYYNQEVVFDISDYSDYFLQGIKLEAYQLDNFETSNGTLLSYNNMLSEPTNNIFIKEPFICLGTAVGEFKKDSIKIVTNSSSTYTTAENKNLKLKWTHQDLNSKDIYVVQEGKIPANYEIRWYKFKLGEPSPDKFMDAHWIRLNNENNKINISFSPDPANQTEQIRAIVLKTENNNPTTLVARSPIITFNNNKEVPNQANLELQKIDANALGIQFTDSENGNYYYYDKTGKIIQKEKSQITRSLKAVFNKNTNLENKGDLDQQPYTSIKWIFPKTNTMIIPLNPEGEDISIGSNVSDAYTVTTINDDNYYEISFENQNGNTDKSILKEMKYRIDEYYSFNKSRNTIYLEVTINGQTYVSSVTMFFGMAGTSGSDYTIVVEWSEGIPVFDVNGGEGYSLNGSVKLLDLNGEPVTLNDSAKYIYSFEENEIYTGLEVEVNNSNSNFKISKNDNISMNDLYLLEVKLTGFGDYDLISKYPIALKNNLNNDTYSIQINGITGTTTVRYASDGTITLDDKNPYSISFQEEKNGKYEKAEDKEVGRWKIHTHNNINHNFLPELIDINEDNSLVENFIQEIKNIKLNENSEITLLDLLISISNTEDSFNIDLLITSIKDTIIDDSIHHYPDSDSNINIFKENLLNVSKDKLKLLFNALENKYINYFSTVFFKKINPILSPPSVYFKDIPLYGVQYILNDDVTILYTQPIYVYQDNYPSGTLNKWNGKDLILNENNGTIIANGFSAGKKEDNNTFTGVMIGNWARTEAENPSITTNTGIYGFHQGVMSYAFTDDGKAFIGKDGKGRIEFDGNNGIIKSAGFIPSTKNQHGYGTLIDLNEGKLQLYSPISIKDKNKADQTDYYLTLSSTGTQEQPFLQISRKRNEVDNFMSKYLNQYYDAYEDLKNYVTEVYNKLVKFAQAYITYQNYDYTISTGTQMSELIPYTYYIMTNFKENHGIDIDNLNSLNKFPELKDSENDGVSIVDNIWKFFYNLSEDDNLINSEKNQYQTLLQKFYNNPTLSNLSEVNIFIKTYIDKYEIEQFVQDSNIINYFFEDVSILLPNDNESLNNNYDEYTQQKKLIKFIFNNSQEPLIFGEQTGLTYYLYNFINFLPSPNTSFQKTTDSLEDIEACITALKNQSTFYIKNSNNQYEPVTMIDKYYHKINGTYYLAYDFWDNENNYKKVDDNNYNQITNESDFNIYYVKVNNKYIRFKYYYSTLTPVDNTTNAEIKTHQNDQSFTRKPILTFEKNKSYYYKDDNNEYIYTNYCDNNNKYFYTKYNSTSIGDYKNLIEFSTNIDYYELIKPISNTLDHYDSNPYQKYQFDFVSSVEEDDNLTETYILKSFILPADTNQQVEREFKVGNGISTLFDANSYRSGDYTKVKIYTNQIYDITLRIDTKSQSSLGLTKDLWPIQGGFPVTEDGITTTYYTSLSFTLREKVFGKDLLDSLIQDKYSFLTNPYISKYLQLIASSSSIKNKSKGMYIQEIEEKINNLNAALRNVLRGIPLAKQSEYKEDFSIRYSRETSETSKKSITLSLLTTNIIKMEKLKEYLQKDISNNFIFDVTSWENDLIKIINDGGYITSKDYRPTIISGDKVVRTPIQSQDSSSSEWRQGMKGFIIDLTNNRIVLGNNSQIEGIQTQYYPGQTNVSHRYFIISTGVNFKPGQGAYSDRDVLAKESNGVNKTYFIRARSGYNASTSSLRDMFYVRWNGDAYIDNKLTVRNINCTDQITSKYFKVSTGFYFGPYHVINVKQLYIQNSNGTSYSPFYLYYKSSDNTYEDASFLCYETET